MSLTVQVSRCGSLTVAEMVGANVASASEPIPLRMPPAPGVEVNEALGVPVADNVIVSPLSPSTCRCSPLPSLTWRLWRSSCRP